MTNKYREYLCDNYNVSSSKELDDNTLKKLKGRLQSKARYRRNKNK